MWTFLPLSKPTPCRRSQQEAHLQVNRKRSRKNEQIETSRFQVSYCHCRVCRAWCNSRSVRCTCVTQMSTTSSPLPWDDAVGNARGWRASTRTDRQERLYTGPRRILDATVEKALPCPATSAGTKRNAVRPAHREQRRHMVKRARAQRAPMSKTQRDHEA